MSAILNRSTLLMLGAIAVALLIPAVVANRFVIDILTLILITAVLGQSWNILGGYAGQFSFGSVVFFGTGAYTSSILLMTYGINPWIGMAAAVFTGAAVGAFIGYLSFRYGLRGSYFALITLAFAEAFRVLANSVEFTGAGIGIFIPHQASFARMQFDHPAGYYYLALVLTGVSIGVAMWLERSRFGAQLMAIRENEDAAEALRDHDLRRDGLGGRDLLRSEVSLHRPAHRLWRRDVGGDVAGDDRWRDGHNFRTPGGIVCLARGQ
jgi:branched-chain amino acid transport system permease protein